LQLACRALRRTLAAALVTYLVQVVPVFRGVHAFRESKTSRADSSVGQCDNETCGRASSGDETVEVWLDHLDELSSIPSRGFHSAFQEGDTGDKLGMKPWTSIHDGISSSTSSSPFNLLFVFGGMQMTTVGESDTSVTAMDSDACYHSNIRVLSAFREKSPSPTSIDPAVQYQHPHHQPHRVLVISRDGTWWRRWLNEKVGPEIVWNFNDRLPKMLLNNALKRIFRIRWLPWPLSSTAASSTLRCSAENMQR
jgi:hypothetical protein